MVGVSHPVADVRAFPSPLRERPTDEFKSTENELRGMDITKTLRDDDDRLTSILPAVGLSVFALLSLRRGKRLRGILAGLGALALGYRASTDSGDILERSEAGHDVGSAPKDVQQHCAACGDPIVAGQRRRPNANDETVHEACLEAPA